MVQLHTGAPSACSSVDKSSRLLSGRSMVRLHLGAPRNIGGLPAPTGRPLSTVSTSEAETVLIVANTNAQQAARWRIGVSETLIASPQGRPRLGFVVAMLPHCLRLRLSHSFQRLNRGTHPSLCAAHLQRLHRRTCVSPTGHSGNGKSNDSSRELWP